MAYTKQFTVRQICEFLQVELPEEYSGIADDTLTNLAYGTKFMQKDGALFLAAVTRQEREAKLDEALEKGVKIVFGSRYCRKLTRIHEVPHVILDNVFGDVIRLSAMIREGVDAKIIGITGSMGKTTTKDMIHAVLSAQFSTGKSAGNSNTIFPVFEYMQTMPKGMRFFIQEFGAATPGVMPRTVQACIPDAGLITNISDAHLDKFETRENLLAEKLKLITQMPAGCPAFLNYDDPLLRQVRLENRPIISYAAENPEAEYHAENLQICDGYMLFDIVCPKRTLSVRLNGYGKYNVGNAVAAAAVGDWAGMSPKKIVSGLAAYRSSGIRQNLVKRSGYTMFIDCYNANPVSMLGAVEVLAGLPVEPEGKRVAVLGGLAALGARSRELHVETGRKIGSAGLDLVLCFGDEDTGAMAESIRAGGTETLFTTDREELEEWMSDRITRKDVTLFKGSHVWDLESSIDEVYGPAAETEPSREGEGLRGGLRKLLDKLKNG